MANFARVKALGWGLKAELESALMNALDIDHTKAPNFDEGSAHDPTEWVEVLGTNGFGIKITGTLVGAGTINMTGSIATSKAVLARKLQPDAIDERSVDCGGGGVGVTLDLTTYDHFELTLSDGGDPTAVAELSSIAFTTVSADVAREVKPGAEFTIVVKAASGQTGGCGMADAPWPASVVGDVASDNLGLRSSASDCTVFKLIQVGTAASPAFRITSVRHGGA